MEKLFKILCLMSLFFLASCLEKEHETKEKIIRPVKYEVVASAHSSFEKRFSGVAKSSLQTRASFKVSGTIKDIYVKVGDKAKKGKLLAEIDPKDFELRVGEIKSQVNRIESQLRNVKSIYQRSRKLFEHRNISKTELDSSRASFESTKAALTSAKKQLLLSERQLEYTKLSSPDDCSIANKLAKRNENIAAGQPVLVLNCGKLLEVDIAVPEINIVNISEGQKVKVRFDAFPDKVFNAEISEVGIASMGKLTTFPVTVSLIDIDSDIRAGMTAEVEISLNNYISESTGKRIYVPSRSVQKDEGGIYVYAVSKLDGVVSNNKQVYIIEKKPIKIGQLEKEGIEVIEGLNVGDYVVTAGSSSLNPGMQVTLLEKAEKR